MPRYYFDSFDGTRFVYDEAGLVLDNPDEARRQVESALDELAQAGHLQGGFQELIVEARDESGSLIAGTAIAGDRTWARSDVTPLSP